MLSWKEQYEGVLYELQKVEAPSFYPDDFFYFLSQARQDVVSELLKAFELTQQVSDALRPLVSEPAEFPVSDQGKRQATLPQDYLRLTGCRVRVLFPKGWQFCFREQQRELAARKLTVDTLGSVMDNYYTRPAPERPYYRLIGDVIRIDIGQTKDVELKTIVLEYMRTPKKVELPRDTDGNVIWENTGKSELTDEVDRLVIRRCAALFLENMESGRLQTLKTLDV
jgi:hypothetical protein